MDWIPMLCTKSRMQQFQYATPKIYDSVGPLFRRYAILTLTPKPNCNPKP